MAALAQDESAADAGAPTDLAIVALHCAEAPAAEALTSYFSSATPPTRCAPAVGVAIAATENGDPVSGGPFTTDVEGTVIIRVGLGSAIEVREDPKTLPPGYEPLAQEANGVPYANPVRLDSAVAGAAVLFVNVPSSVATALAQDTPAEAGEPTDLAVVALHCADAPATEALTSYLRSGTAPSGCSPAAGVTVAVTENDKPLSGSPFQTDTAGTLAVRVGVGSKVTVKEDTKSLPSGYEPLTQEANGVPYANPVRLDSAVAGAAVLFVNVPASVAAKLNNGTSTVDSGEATGLPHAVALDRTGCDPAYPDARTCIAPGRPLAQPCSITDQRNFTVLPPDPRRLDADRDGIGCEPSSPSGGTINQGARFNLYTSGDDLRRATPARTGDLSVAASPVRGGDGVWVSPPGSSRADDWFVHRDRSRAGLWFGAPDRSSSGNLAIVSNPVFIGRGLWTWPNWHDNVDWFWQSHNHDGIWFWPNRISVGNLTIANSGNGSGNVAVVSNPIFISSGVWHWPDRTDGDDWPWRNRLGNGSWFWPNRISVGNITVAGSGNGNVAIASNPVFIGQGIWTWSGRPRDDDWFWRNRFNNGIWGWPKRIAVGNLAVARSGNGNLAVVSNPVFISNGVRTWPNRPGNDDGRDRLGNHVWGWPSTISVGNLTIARSSSGSGNIAVVSNPVFISHGVWALPNRHDNDDWFWKSRNRDDDWRGRNRFGNGIWGWPSTISVGNITIAGSGNGNVAIASNPVFISSGVWHWPGHINNGFWLWPNHGNNGHWRWPNHIGTGIWGWPSNISIGNLTIARSGSGNIAIVSNPIVISSGVWFVPPDRDHDDWLGRGDSDRADDQLVHARATGTDESNVEAPTVNGGVASEAPPSKIEQVGSSEQPTLTINGGLAVEPPPADSMQPPSDGATLAPAEVGEPASEGDIAQPGNGNIEAPSVDDGLAVEPPSGDIAEPPIDDNVAPPADAGALDPGYVDAGVDAGNPAADPGIDSGYVATDPAVDPGIVGTDPGIDPGYIAPDQGAVAPDPGYSPPDSSYVDPGYVEPSVEPSYGEPSYVDPGIAAPDSGYVTPDPVYVAPDPSYAQPEPVYAQDPSYVDPGSLAPDPGIDLGNVASDPGYYADPGVGPGNADLGNDPGYVNSGNVATEPSYIAPDPSFDQGVHPGNADLGGDLGSDSGNVAPDPGAGHAKRDRGDHHD